MVGVGPAEPVARWSSGAAAAGGVSPGPEIHGRDRRAAPRDLRTLLRPTRAGAGDCGGGGAGDCGGGGAGGSGRPGPLDRHHPLAAGRAGDQRGRPDDEGRPRRAGPGSMVDRWIEVDRPPPSGSGTDGRVAGIGPFVAPAAPESATSGSATTGAGVVAAGESGATSAMSAMSAGDSGSTAAGSTAAGSAAPPAGARVRSGSAGVSGGLGAFGDTGAEAGGETVRWIGISVKPEGPGPSTGGAD